MKRPGGFTLVELIIALALISMALALGFGALRIAARSMENTDRLVNELEQLRVVSSVVQLQLSQVRPLQESLTARQVNFSGDSQQLEFVAPAPSQGGRLMGLYRYRLRLIAADAKQQLVLDYQPYVPGVAQWPAAVDTAVLMDGIKAGEFGYFGASKEAPEQWQTNWRGVDHLPRMVRLALVRSAAGEEPLEWVVALPVERGR